MPPPSLGAEAPRTAEPTAPADGNVVVVSHAQYVPTLQLPDALTPRPGYLDLCFDLLTLKVVSESV